ncbi:MAG: hypothetical protein ACO3UU_08400 [Minisyncoccia bacterium]
MKKLDDIIEKSIIKNDLNQLKKSNFPYQIQVLGYTYLNKLPEDKIGLKDKNLELLEDKD